MKKSIWGEKKTHFIRLSKQRKREGKGKDKPKIYECINTFPYYCNLCGLKKEIIEPFKRVERKKRTKLEKSKWKRENEYKNMCKKRCSHSHIYTFWL